MESQNNIILFTKITASYNLLIVILSCILNPLIFFICVKSNKIRSTSTFKLLAIGAINDFLAAIPWNFIAFTNSFFDFYPFAKSLFFCRVISIFIQFTCLQLTSWLLVSISLDRFLSMVIKQWSKRWFSGSRPVIYGLFLALFIIAVNFNVVFTAGFSFTLNGTEIIFCFANRPDEFQWYNLMSQVFFLNLRVLLRLKIKQIKFSDSFVFWIYCAVWINAYPKFAHHLQSNHV